MAVVRAHAGAISWAEALPSGLAAAQLQLAALRGELPGSKVYETAERPATTAQFTGLKSATWAIHPGMMFAAS